MKYPRIVATSQGESRFEDIEVTLQAADVVPGRPVFESAAIAATALTLMRVEADWDGSWHPTPRRWFVVTLAGEMEITTSDGETRRFGPGGLWLMEDTAGKGHNTRVLAVPAWDPAHVTR